MAAFPLKGKQPFSYCMTECFRTLNTPRDQRTLIRPISYYNGGGGGPNGVGAGVGVGPGVGVALSLRLRLPSEAPPQPLIVANRDARNTIAKIPLQNGAALSRFRIRVFNIPFEYL